MDYSDTGDVTGQLVATNDIVIPPGASASSSKSGGEPVRLHPCIGDRGTRWRSSSAAPVTSISSRSTHRAYFDAAIIFNEGQPGRDETLAGTLFDRGRSVEVPRDRHQFRG